VALLNIDVPSRLVVAHEGRAVGSIDLVPDIAEPLLPWIVREITTRLRKELMLEFARVALLRDPSKADPSIRFLEAL
jgi:hypothetical protein